jgi:alpha-N-arabinofuranosidase
MSKAKITINKNYKIGKIDDRIYGSFVEHLGRCVYGGIYEPDHPNAGSDGFRKDVIELVKELNIPVIRYPGGNFVSGYNWEDGVGPVENRPKRKDLAWHVIEPNTVGTNEFASWAKKVNADVMMAVNLGTRGVDEARNFVEYCNHPSGTYLSDLRIKHGVKDPHNIKLWCLGNEMDGPWQMGFKTAKEYGRLACESARVMKWVDPSIELVACGSSGYNMPTFGSWEAEVLDETYDLVDYISMHTYYGKGKMSTPTYLAQTLDMEEFIKRTIATCDYVGAKKKSNKKINISFDEWNVWMVGTEDPKYREIYSIEDAVLFGSMMISLLRHADRIKVACQAQLVNVIAPIFTQKGGSAIKQTIFYPYLHGSLFGRGTTLQTLVECDKYNCPNYSDVPYIDSIAVETDKGVTLFISNRSNEEVILECKAENFTCANTPTHTAMYEENILAQNTFENPDNVKPKNVGEIIIEDGVIKTKLNSVSWNMIQF